MSTKKVKKKFSRNRLYKQIASCIILIFVFSFFVFLVLIYDLPDLNNLESKGRRASIVFESYDGQTIATYGDLFRDVIDIDKIPRHVKNAVIAVEDRRFYLHGGVDVIGIIRAMYTNVVLGRIAQGGSTLTQQLAKNLFLSQSKSIKRKTQEFILALWLEKKFTKKQILSIYLNRVYFGSCAYGIDAAAHRYFGKKVHQLTLYESAKLAGVLKAPTLYSPFYNPDKSDKRTETVLSCMVEAEYITENEMKEALLQKDKLSRNSVPMDENRYFTDWVIEQLDELIGANYEDIIVRTTLNSKLQKNATYVIRKVLMEHGFKKKASQMALVCIDKTGAVRVMVGGHTYGDSQFNRVLAVRSFGSSFKYFVYLSALEKGMSMYDLISDRPLSIGNWSPKNYKYKSMGEISLLEAFVKSVNTSTIRIAQRVGMDYIIGRAEQLGISNELNNNLATALGCAGVSLLDITSCYGATMIGGYKMNPFGVVSIRKQNGKFIYKAYQKQSKHLISNEVCEKMKVMMREIVNRGTGRNAKLPNIDCFGKTGTSNDSRDASFIGFANPIVTGVWIGNDDNSPMDKSVTGGTLPAMAWKEFMSLAFGIQKVTEKIEIDKNKIKINKDKAIPKNLKKRKKIVDMINL
jgi:penicillin-binding protein 1A